MNEAGTTDRPLANIGPRGCGRRGAMGWVWLALGAALVAILIARGAPVAWHALAAVPFLLGTLGFFQAREQTCVFFAATGHRDMDGGAERITEPGELASVRRQATTVWLRAVGAAMGLLMLTFAIALSLR